MLSPEILRVISQSQQSLYRINFSSGVIFIVLGVAAMVGSLFAPPTGLRGFLLGSGVWWRSPLGRLTAPTTKPAISISPPC
jgi:hypothetical protein